MSSSDLFLGIDMGTTSVKVTLINEKWKPLKQIRNNYKSYQVQPMWIEQDPWEWWWATCSAIKEVISLSKTDAKKIKAIAVSSQAPTLLGIDRDGNPLGRAIIWMDRRAEKECETITSIVGQSTVQDFSGNRIDPYYLLPKIYWEKTLLQEKYFGTHKYLQANGWIIFQLTGKYSIDVSHACLTQLFNIYQNQWETPLLKELGINKNKLPEVYDCMEVVGQISSGIGDLLGLEKGTPVIAGAIDGATAPLGLKLIETNQSFEMSGQSSGIGVILDAPLSHPKLALLRHAVDGKWILKGSMSASGGSLRWFRDNIDEEPDNPCMFEEYERLVAQSPPGSNGLLYLPYLAGERAPIWDSFAKGVFFGIHLQTVRADMVRSIMEGTAYGLRSILEEIKNAGIRIDKLFGTGGGYLSKEWSQIKADILEREIQVAYSDIETASLGTSYLALMAMSRLQPSNIPNFTIMNEYRPRKENQLLYGNYYSIFKNLYENNRLLFKNLALVGEAH